MPHKFALFIYWKEVFAEAWSESLDVAQAILFIALTCLGGMIAMFPHIAKSYSLLTLLHTMVSWEGAAITLAAVIFSRLLVAPFNLNNKDKNEIEKLKGKLQLVGLERGLSYVNCSYIFEQKSLDKNIILLIKRILIMENSSNKIIQYKIKKIWLRNLKEEEYQYPTLSEIQRNGFISARKIMHYVLSSSNGGLLLGEDYPINWIFGFEIEYDNVPAISTRTIKYEIKHWLRGKDPFVFDNIILLREEN